MSLKTYVHHEHQNVTTFENRVFVDVIKGSWDEIILDLEQAINSMTSVLKRRGRGSETQERRPCEDWGKNWSYVTMGPPETVRGKEGFSPRAQRNGGYANSLILDADHSCEESKVILF